MKLLFESNYLLITSLEVFIDGFLLDEASLKLFISEKSDFKSNVSHFLVYNSIYHF